MSVASTVFPSATTTDSLQTQDVAQKMGSDVKIGENKVTEEAETSVCWEHLTVKPNWKVWEPLRDITANVIRAGNISHLQGVELCFTVTRLHTRVGSDGEGASTTRGRNLVDRSWRP